MHKDQCRICQHYSTVKKVFGRPKQICALTNQAATAEGICGRFRPDGDKILAYAGFRPRAGSTDGCDSCAHRMSKHENGERQYICQKNNVVFPPEYVPLHYVCDNFEDGGFDALAMYMSDLWIEENKLNKGK